MIWITLPVQAFEHLGLKLEINEDENDELSVEFTDYQHVKLKPEVQEWFDARTLTPQYRRNQQCESWFEIGFEDEAHAVEFKLIWN